MREEAVALLLESPNLKRLKSTMQSGDDVFQEMVLAYLELPDEKADRIFNEGYLNWWAFRTMCNINSKTHKIGKHLIKSTREVAPSKDKSSENEIALSYEIFNQIDATIELDKIESALQSLYWYDRELFKIYLKEGSLRKTEAATGIHYTSVKFTVDKVREALSKV